MHYFSVQISGAEWSCAPKGHDTGQEYSAHNLCEWMMLMIKINEAP